MATRTNYVFTADDKTSKYPDDTDWTSGSADSTSRYSKIGAAGTTFKYPLNNDNGFNVPNLRFIFLDAYARNVPSSPIINLKMPSSFNITAFSDYSRTENIFGGGAGSDIDIFSSIARATGAEKYAGDTATAADKAVVTGAEAFQYAVLRGLASSLGFAGAAGLNNLSQYEFANRIAINPMAQLLYKGPQFRRYQIPVQIKPKSEDESKQIKKIISIFRVASSPSVPSTSGSFGEIQLGAGSTFQFGYPHLTQFSAYFMDPDTNGSKRTFRSHPCVIESVSVDYGGGQRMTMFSDGTPSEMTLTMQLTEIMPRTLADSITDANDSAVKIL